MPAAASLHTGMTQQLLSKAKAACGGREWREGEKRKKRRKKEEEGDHLTFGTATVVLIGGSRPHRFSDGSTNRSLHFAVPCTHSMKQSIDDVGVTRLAETGRMLTEAGPKSRRGQEERNAPDEEEAQSPTKPVRVEVCLGPDCQGGATLLESKSPRLCVCASFSALNTHNRNPTVEELVSSRTTMASKPRTRRDITVGSTGCRDFCTVGPNVYVRSASEDEHFTRVDGPQACRRVVSSILADDTSGRDEALSSTQALLKRREDGIRWRRHKERVCREKRLRVLKRKVK